MNSEIALTMAPLSASVRVFVKKQSAVEVIRYMLDVCRSDLPYIGILLNPSRVQNSISLDDLGVYGLRLITLICRALQLRTALPILARRSRATPHADEEVVNLIQNYVSLETAKAPHSEEWERRSTQYASKMNSYKRVAWSRLARGTERYRISQDA